MSTWPEVIKQRGPFTSTCKVDYIYRPAMSYTTYKGAMSVNYDTIGSSQLVFCHKKSRWRPGTLKLQKVQMRKVTQTATDDNYTYDPGGYTYPKVGLAGPIAGLFSSTMSGQANMSFGISWDQLLAERALQEAYGNWGKPQADVGVMIGEAAETLQFLRSPLKSVVNKMTSLYNSAVTTRNIRRRDRVFKATRSLNDIMSDLWLSARYGIIPLINDINSLCSYSMSKLVQPEVPFYRVSGSERLSSKSSSKNRKTILVLYFDWIVEVEWEMQASARVFYKHSWWYVPQFEIPQSLGLEVTDIPIIVYELIPLSFALDWVVDFGGWLRAHKPRPGYVYLGNCVSCKTTVKTTWSNIGVTTNISSYPNAPMTSSKAFRVDETLDRQVNLPLPSTPQFANGLKSLTHQVDALTLIWQRLPNYFQKRKG